MASSRTALDIFQETVAAFKINLSTSYLIPEHKLDILEIPASSISHHQPGKILDITPKEQLFDVPLDDEIKTSPPANLKPRISVPSRKYFSVFRPTEINHQLRKYTLLRVVTKEDLEKLLADNAAIYWLFRLSFSLSILLNLGYIAFVATTGAQGIETAGQTISSRIHLSHQVGEGIGIPMGILDVGLYTLAFSADKEAVISTLEFLVWRSKPIRTRLQEMLSYAYHLPHKAGGYLLFAIMLLTFNSATMMTVLLGFINDLSPAGIIGLSLVVLSFGNLYMTKFSNVEAHEGLHQFWGNKKLPWLLENIFRHGNIANSLEAMWEGLCTSILTAFPVYYYIGQTIAKDYHLPSDVAQGIGISVAAFTFLRGLCVMYPIPYHRYIDPPREVDTLIQKAFRPYLSQASSSQQVTIINAIAKKIENEVKREKNSLQLLASDNTGLMQSLFRIGATVAVGTLSILDPSPSNILISTACLGLALIGIKTSINHSTTLATVNKVQPLLPPSDIIEVDELLPNNRRGRWLKALALLLSVDSAATDLITVMGSILLDNSVLKLFLLIAAFDRLITSVSFNYKKVAGTISSFIQDKSSPIQLTQTANNFFSPQASRELQITATTKVIPPTQTTPGLQLSAIPER